MTAAAHVFEVGVAEFEADVLYASRDRPVVVDFWAPWCGPCRTLGPVLEKLAAEYAGAFALAKVNTDEHPELGQRYGVRGIPNVKLFRDGAPVDEFVGALPEAAVRAFLDRHCPSEADALIDEAVELLAAGGIDDARAKLDAALALSPDLAPAHLALARMDLAAGDADGVRRHAKAISPAAPEAEVAAHLIEALGFTERAREAGGEAACRARLAEHPRDRDAQLGLAASLAAAARYRDALDAYLRAVELDARYRDGEARRAMLTIFGLVGARSTLADDYRRKLMILI
jgi:putative thioredoxin